MLQVVDKKGMKILAQNIAQRVKGGEVFLLIGDLGSGKTFFVQQIAKFLGAKRAKSPTFVILNIHRTRKKIFLAHFDFYRLEKSEIANFEWQEFLFNSKYICFIEWGEKIKPFLKNKKFFEIDFKWLPHNKREINLSSNLKKWLKNSI